MKLSILVPALRSRRKLRKELEAVLLPQVESHRDVELLIEEDVGRLPSGEKRNRLIARSAGEYFAFVDDDDLVAGDYVRRLRVGCRSGAAVVSFWGERVGNDRPRQIHEFSIRHRDQERLPNGNLGMAANHLCAWRRDVGTAVAFPPHLGYNDDLFWYTPLLESGLAKTEHHLPRVLYTYRYDSSRTENQRREAVQRTYRWAAGGVDCFRLPDGRIVVAVAGRRHSVGRSTVRVRDRNNHVHDLPRQELRLFSTVRAR